MQDAWWYLIGDTPKGPVSMEMLDALLHAGEITPDSLVWKAGQDWAALSECLPPKEVCAQPAAGLPSMHAPTARGWRRFLPRWARPR